MEKKLLALVLFCRPFYRLPPFSWRFLAPVRKRGFIPLLKRDLFRIFSAIGAHPTARNTQCRPTCCNLENSASQIFATQPTQRSQLEKNSRGEPRLKPTLSGHATRLQHEGKLKTEVSRSLRRQGLFFFLYFVPNKCSSSSTLSHVTGMKMV